MDQHQSILRRAGWLLVAIGCVDIAFMIYCIVNGWSYSSSFNIFSVVAGILLLRGSLRTARVITWFLAFFLAAFGTLLIAFPFPQPPDLWMLRLRSDLSGAALSLAIWPIILALLAWIYGQLRSPAVLNASLSAGLKTSGYRFHLAGMRWAGNHYGTQVGRSPGQRLFAAPDLRQQTGSKCAGSECSLCWRSVRD